MVTAHQYANDNAEAFRDQFCDWLRIPSVSALSERAVRVRDAAAWLADNMRHSGIEHAEIVPTDGHPVVIGDWLHAPPGVPTVLVGYYDVQPAEIDNGWQTRPFDPVLRDGKIYTRGVGQDKGQLFIHNKATESLLRAEGRLPVNVIFLFEGKWKSVRRTWADSCANIEIDCQPTFA